MKKILIIIPIILILIFAVYYLLNNNRVTFTRETSYYKAIPNDVPLFIELNSLKAIPNNNKIIVDLTQNEILSTFLSKIDTIEDLIVSSKEINNNIRNDKIIIAFNNRGRQDIIPLYIMKAENNTKKNSFEILLHELFPENQYYYNKKQYNSNNIINIESKNNNIQFSYSFINDLIIGSPNSLIIEKSIRQLDSENLMNDNYFVLINKNATDQANASTYINHKFFPGFFEKWINSGVISKINEFGRESNSTLTDEIQRFSDYALWSELNLSFSDDGILLNGSSYASDSLNNFLSVFKGQEPVRLKTDQLIPKSTSVYLSYSLTNKELFFSNLDYFFEHNDLFYPREEYLKKIISETGMDLKQIFEEILEDEMAISFSEIPEETENMNSYFIISTKGKNIAKETFSEFLTQYTTRNNKNLSDLIRYYQVDNELSHEIYSFPYPSFPGNWLGGPFKTVSANFMTFWDNSIIFGNSIVAIENILYNLTLESTLDNDLNYLAFKQNIENRANINFYLDIYSAYNLNKNIFTKDVSELLINKEEILEKFSALNWQVINTKDQYFNNIYLNYPEVIEEEARTTWQSSIGSEIIIKPQLTRNHTDIKNMEIIIQDEKNNLHQINKEGRSRWIIKLPEKIMSNIFQIDLFKNGKYQYLFNTKSKLYVIDRDGNNVSPFPINLRSEATNGVNVFDYDNNRDYRFFIAGEDKKIYVYDSQGNIVSGWNFGQTDYPVTHPVQHFRVLNKDYIVFKDKSKIYIQDRRGETRVELKAKFENSDNPLILNTNGTPKIITTDITGAVYYLFFDGEFTKIETGPFSESHLFNVDDLDGDRILDFIFIDKDNLFVINENKKNIFTKEFNNPIEEYPNIYTFSDKLKKIGVVSYPENRVFLYNPDGTLHQGFPLIGNTSFSIGKLESDSPYFNLIVGSKDGNLYNYQLN